MKRFGRSFVLFCMAALLLAGTAYANSAMPHYVLVVKVVNGPEEPYCLDFLDAGSYKGVHMEVKGTDPALLEALRQAVPEGWYACAAEGSLDIQGDLAGRDGVHTISGWLPEEFRLLIVTASGESWVSDVLERKTAEAAVTVDWAAKTAKMPSPLLAYALQFLSTLLPTLAVEGLLLPAFGFSWRKNWRPFLLVNLVTQGALALFLNINLVRSGSVYGLSVFLLMLAPAELVIALVEAELYTKLLKGRSQRRAFLYGIAANAASYALGWVLVEAVYSGLISLK